MAFTHLHVHSEYSLLDGACRIEPMVKRAKALGMDSLAITDHGVMYGVVDFYQACLKEGVHPVIGCEVYVAPGSRFDKTAANRESAHLVLLCENQTGYKNLIKLCSAGFLEGYYYRPRIDMELLAAHSQGLIALSACLSGDIPRLILDGQMRRAAELARRFVDIMGEGNFYLELQDHGIPEEKTVSAGILRLAQETGIPLVVTNDAHYLLKEDAKAQEVLMCIQTGKTLEDESRMRMNTDELYLKSEEEMASLFPQVPEALENTHRIAMRCQVAFTFGHYYLPDFPVPGGEDHGDYLERLCYAGAKDRYGQVEGEVKQRLEYELSVIRKMGYVDYFLIVWDFIHFARNKDIPVGPGRGSGAGSICAYALGITGIDPLRYGLIFERFLNPDRISMPDFDIDFCYERRQEVIDYVVRRYGEDHVSQIITFGTMAAKGVVRDVGRVLGMPYAEADQIAKLIPAQLNMTLNKALEISTELRNLRDNDPKVQELLKYCLLLEGMPRHASTHAAGVLIGAQPLSELVPLQTNDQIVTTQFPMGTIEQLGLLKIDFLGLRTLTVIKDACDLVKESLGVAVDIERVSTGDAQTYEMLGRGDTDGVFQLESAGMRRLTVDLAPQSVEDICAAISLYRPGPMESIPRYIKGRKDPSSIHYASPILENVLSVTYGCMLYQEQVMQIVRDMAGYSMGRSDLVRRAMAKKKKKEMEKERQVFVDGLEESGQVVVPGAVRLGTSREVALQVFGEMESFAEYAFNKSHGVAYALVALQTAYLKCHYPVQFMAATLNSVMGNGDKSAAFIQFCRKNGITVLPPNVNRSSVRFTVEDGAIRFGLAAVRNVGQGAAEAIIKGRKQGPYTDLYAFCDRVDPDAVNKRVVESLIKAGAMDDLEGNRAQKLGIYERVMDGAAQEKKRSIEGQLSLFGTEEFEVQRAPLPDLPEHPRRFLLMMEKEMTGVYLSGHPLDEYRQILERNPQNTALLLEYAQEEDGRQYDGIPVALGGLLLEARMKTTRNNALMCFIKLEDFYGVMEGLVFPKVYEKIGKLLQTDAAVEVTGRLSVREEEEPKLIVQGVSLLSEKINKRRLYLRLSGSAQMPEVTQALGQYRGLVEVRVCCQDKTYVLPESCWVDPGPEALERLRQIVGPENLRLV